MIAQLAVRGQIVQSLLSADFKAQFADRDPYRVLLDSVDVDGQMRGRPVLHQSMYLWSKTALPNRLLTYLGDRMEMANSIEGRTPFLDHHLAEAVVAMPPAMKINGMTEKYVLREAARPYVTSTVYRRQKHPFLAPIGPAGGLVELAQAKLHEAAFVDMPFFDQKAVVRLLNRASPTQDKTERDRLFSVLLLLTSTAVLHERYRL